MDYLQNSGKLKKFNNKNMEIDKVKNKGIIRDFFDFLWQRKVWWMLPIVIVLLVVGFLIILMQSNYVSPFIYAL